MSKKEIFRSLVDRNISIIEIPRNITKIGAHAFAYCTNLTSLIIPNNITELDSGIIAGATGITTITIPNSITDLNCSAFSQSSISELNIPNSVTKMSGSFFEVNKLKTIIIPSSVTSIGSGCFSNALGALTLKTITFNHSNGMAIDLPTGLFKCKTASSLTVYTDNETIKNYDYSADNVTPTFYHLDGSAWA